MSSYIIYVIHFSLHKQRYENHFKFRIIMKNAISFSCLAVLPDVPMTSSSTAVKTTTLINKKAEPDQVVEHVERLEPVLPDESVGVKQIKDVKDPAQTPPKSLAEIKQQEIFDQPKNSLDGSWSISFLLAADFVSFIPPRYLDKDKPPLSGELPVRDSQVVPPAERLKRESFNESLASTTTATINGTVKPKQEN